MKTRFEADFALYQTMVSPVGVAWLLGIFFLNSHSHFLLPLHLKVLCITTMSHKIVLCNLWLHLSSHVPWIIVEYICLRFSSHQHFSLITCWQICLQCTIDCAWKHVLHFLRGCVFILAHLYTVKHLDSTGNCFHINGFFCFPFFIILHKNPQEHGSIKWAYISTRIQSRLETKLPKAFRSKQRDKATLESNCNPFQQC